MNLEPNFNDIEKIFTLASQHFQAGQLSEAEETYQQILRNYPDHPRALHALGVIAHCAGKGDAAIALIRRAIVARPDFPEAFNNLGNVLKELGRLDEAIASYQSAITLKPDFTMARNNLGNSFKELGRFDEAITCFQQTLAIKPDDPETLNDLGNTLTEQGKPDKAIENFTKALSLCPDSAVFHNNLGNALIDTGKIDKAITYYQIAIFLKPDYANAYNNIGFAFAEQGRLDEAVSYYQQAIELKPDYALAYNNLGNAYRVMGKLDEAVANHVKAITIRVNYHEAYNNLAVTLTEQGKLAEAFEHYKKCLAIKPDYAPAHSNLIFSMNYSPDVTAEEIFEESCRWDKVHAKPIAARSVASRNDTSPNQRLRIGYVSPDFREHSISYFFEPLITNHDRDKIEVFCYSDVHKPDKTTRRLKKHADRWIDCVGLSDTMLVERIRRDRIDILVDLAGHTALNRLAVFTERLAPVQLSWLGYPNTTGLSTMDYRLTDGTVDPEGAADSLHTEKLFRLPGAFLCYLPPAHCPRVSPLPAHTKGFVTFGSFNNLTKLTSEVIALWGRLLSRVPASRLILKNKALADGSTQSRYRQMFADNGIAADRVELLSFEPSTKSHLEIYNRVDIALDPFPYNGTTTTCEALWMGVPVISLLGDRHAARVGAIILHCVGLDELIAKNADEYLDTAANLANDLKRLAAIRGALRKQVASSPLCNAEEFANKIETAFRQMWLQWRNSYSSPVLSGSSPKPAEETNPAALSALFDRASQLFRDGCLHEAEEIYTRILRTNPDHPRALHALGVIAYSAGEGNKAISLIRKAVETKPDFADAFNNLGNVYKDLGRIDEAIDSYEAALAINPALAMTHNNLGNVYRNLGWMEKALHSFDRALEINPAYEDAYNGIAAVLTFQGRVDEAMASYRKALAIKPDFAKAHSNMVFAMNYSPRFSAKQIYDESFRWNKIHAISCAAEQKPRTNKANPDRRLRVGYVSPDFHKHSVSYFSEPLIAAHDRSKVEIFCYADVANPDQTTRRFQKLADNWRTTAWLKHEALAEQIREDRIDILVDLAGHTAGTRLLIFAEKPAPVQVTWLGYPSTTGLSSIDYRLTDSIADPEGLTDSFHSEKLIRLPGCFLCYDPPAEAPKVPPLPAIENGFVTFGSFNNLAKITPEVIALWARLLNRIPDSRLVLKNASLADPSTCRLYLQMLEQSNVDPSRVSLLPIAPSTREHLSLYGRIDIALDPFPYNGTTTTCEALWMGVPVITLLGDRHAGRVGASILHSIGLDEHVAKTPEEYLGIARNLAGKVRQLAELRKGLRKLVAASPLCDATSFARNIEDAYRQMWRTWCKEENSPATSEHRNYETRQKQDIMSGMQLDDAFASAARHVQSGMLEQGEEVYRRILRDHPDHPRALHALGVIRYRSGEVADALHLIGRAIALQPDFADALNNQGNILREQGRLGEALASYQRAVAINPSFAVAHNNLGNTFRELDKAEEALTSYQRAVASNPDFSEAYNGLAATMVELGMLDDAVACYRQAIALNQGFAEAYNNLGNALDLQGNTREAVEYYQKALSIRPDFTKAFSNLGNAFMKLGKPQKAKRSYEKALMLNPDFAEAYYNLGNWYSSRNRAGKAATSFQKAIDIRPDFAEAYSNLGNVLKDQTRLAEALECYRAALRIKPDMAETRSNMLIAMHYSPLASAESIYYESLAWQTECGENNLRESRFCVDREPGKKLRIGYVSADFGRHPIGYFLSPVLAAHDRTQVETYCYSGRACEDDLTVRLKNSADNWRSTVGVNDDDLTDMITSDRIDILVDLSGHMGGNRLRVFARKPAPVQATWAGYVGTTGLSAIDYIISDWQETPAGSEHWHAEKVIRLPDCYVCYEPPDYAPPVSALPARLNGHVTFGCFNNLAKLNGNVAELWSRILKEVAGSRLLLITRELNDPETCKLIKKKFADLGVADRVILTGSLPHLELLAAYSKVDIALDPFPYSGGLTTLESLWMGVPVVTLGGERFASRHSVTHLTAAGLSELIVDGPDAYLACITSLAADLVKLERFRQDLRMRMATSPLCDAIRFTHNLEAAFRRMWQAWCEAADSAPPPGNTSSPRQGEAAEIQVESALEAAANCFQEGRLQVAENMYSQILLNDPDHPRALHALGIIAHSSGERERAVSLMRRAIKIKPDFADACNNLGNILKELGRLDEACISYQDAIALKPDFAEALYNQGNILSELGRLDESLASFQKALQVKADYAEALCNMGIVLTNLGRQEEAIASYRKAIKVKPAFLAAYNNLANVLLVLGERTEAVACYREAVRIDPLFAEAHFNLGNTLADLGEHEEALASYREAVRINPAFAEGYNNLGNLLRKRGCLDESVAVYRKALHLKPDFAEVHNNLGIALKEQGKIGEAVASYQRAIAFDPAFAEAYSNFGDVLRGLGRLDEAVASCRKALALKGDFSEAYNRLGYALYNQGKLEEALTNYEQTLAIEPGSAMAHNNLGNVLAAQGRLEDSLASYRQALAVRPDYNEAHSNLLLTMNYSPRCSAQNIFEESLCWNEIHAEPRGARRKPYPNSRDKGRRLRVGYVSSDFHKHSVSYFLEPLLAAHNRRKVEIYCYADVIKPDDVTMLFQALADGWHYTIGMTDEAVAEKIRSDRIDILVDLAGHTAGNRLLVFAEKPAPVQVTWLGYPNTTGMSTMDYRLSDAVADPMELIQQLHSETLVHLPDGLLCYAPPSDAPKISSLPASKNGYFTFGSFNALAKTTVEVVELWGKLLASLPHSRLILKNNSFVDATTRDRYLEMFQEYGVAPSRITLLSMTATTRSHLDLYGEIDVALDPFPYNGTTTTCEALWMGVPVVTLLGERHSCRVGASILHRLKLDDLVARSPDDYINIAIELAHDPKRLTTLRRTLRKRMSSSALCNARNFARSVESAYREMWDKWCEEQS